MQITILQKYSVHRTQAKYKMTEITNNGNPIVSGPDLGQITSGKWVGAQNEKCPNRDI